MRPIPLPGLPDFRRTFDGAKLRETMERSEIDVRTVAAALGRTPEMIRRYQRNSNVPGVDVVAEILLVIDPKDRLRVDDFLRRIPRNGKGPSRTRQYVRGKAPSAAARAKRA